MCLGRRENHPTLPHDCPSRDSNPGSSLALLTELLVLIGVEGVKIKIFVSFAATMYSFTRQKQEGNFCSQDKRKIC